MIKMQKKIIIWSIALIISIPVLFTVPVSLCGLGAGKWLEDDLKCQVQLSAAVEKLLLAQSVSQSNFHTGASQFDGEWLFGSYVMAGIGFSQMAITHPELRTQQQKLVKECINRILTEKIKAFDTAMWNADPIESIGTDNAHVAYLGYLNFVLGLYRLAFDDDSYNQLNDKITKSFIRQLEKSKLTLLESYPDELYPVDNCFMIGSIGLHQRVTGINHNSTINRWINHIKEKYVDKETGLLIQAVNPFDGEPGDEPRGSGTALGILAVHYADPQFAYKLYQAIKISLARNWLGFGAVREYPINNPGKGDIDSGPIIFGYGLSATGFSIAGAKRYNDKKFFWRLYATATLCGAPIKRNNKIEYISGGPLGNAILFAMLTVPQSKNINIGDTNE